MENRGIGGLVEWLQTEPGQAALAGAAGGLVRWLTLRERPADGAVSLVVGTICALYLGPLVGPILEPVVGKIAPDGAPGFASFVCGLGGIGLAGTVIDLMRRFRRAGAEGRPDAE